jgi:uncharacterized membrane protein YfcA
VAGLLSVDPLLVLGTAVVICIGGIMQSAIGFAYALFAIPLMVWMGVPLPKTIVIVSTCSCIQSAFGARQLRAEVPWSQAGAAIAMRVAGVFVCLALLKRLALLKPDDVRLVVGCIICLLVGIQLLFRVRPAEKVHPAWGVLAFSTSGFLTGISGMGGPPLVIWAMAHDWSGEKIRAFLFVVYMASTPVQVLLLYLAFGADMLRGAAVGLLLAPVVYLGTAVGLPLGKRIPRPAFRKLAYGVLVTIALGSVLPRIWQVFQLGGR